MHNLLRLLKPTSNNMVCSISTAPRFFSKSFKKVTNNHIKNNQSIMKRKDQTQKLTQALYVWSRAVTDTEFRKRAVDYLISFHTIVN